MNIGRTALSFTARQHDVRLPSDVKEEALRWVQTQTATAHRKPSDAPFSRLIDFWFAAIAWAVHRGLRPPEKASGPKFVNLGPKPNDIRHFEAWRAQLLGALAVSEWGHESNDVRDSGKVMDLANRYAEAGARDLLRHLEEAAELEVPVLYQVADVFAAEVKRALETANRTYF